MARIVIDDNTKERGSSIVIREEADFIQECKITDITLDSEKKFVEVTVENMNGLTCSSRFYLPKEPKAYENEKKYQNACDIFIKNMVNILRRYKGAKVTLDAQDEVDLAEKVIRIVTPLLNTRTVYTLFELNENEKGIFTRISGIAPFADSPKELYVSAGQKKLLAKKNGEEATPDADSKFMNSPFMDDKLPF